MTHAYERQTANLLTAASLVVGERVAAAAASALPLGASAPTALVALESPGAGETIDGLRRVLGLTHSGTVRVVDRLAAAGYVERRTGQDARSVSLALTPAGRRATRRVLAAREAAVEEVLSRLGPADRARIGDLLAAMLAGEPRRSCRLCDVDACRHGRRCPAT